MSVSTQNFLRARRDRLVGTVLGHLESHVKSKLTKAEWEEVRQAVQSAANSYHDTVLDLLKVEDGMARNDEVIALLERLDRHVRTEQRPPAHV